MGSHRARLEERYGRCKQSDQRRALSSPAMTRTLDFYFDFVCPYAYLAFTEVEGLAAECDADLVYKPTLLGGVFRAIGAPDAPVMAPARARLGEIDLQRWATRRGLELVRPAGHPRRTVLALRAAIASNDLPRATRALYEAYWKRGEDLELPAVVAAALDAAGLDGAGAVARASSDEIKASLRARTDEAVAAGVFGAPAFVTHARGSTNLFWGQDRTDFVRRALTGEWPKPAPRTPRRPTAEPVAFYFDLSSPFAYLASTQVAALSARTGVSIAYRPILLGALFKSIGTPNVPLFAMPPPKQAYYAHELARWSERWGVPFQQSSRFPINTVRPLRIVLSAAEGARPKLVDAFFRAVWADDRDVGDEAVLRSIIEEAGQDADALLAASLAEPAKLALREATAEAEARGVFGVPTFAVGDALFWGQDRLELVEDAIALPGESADT